MKELKDKQICLIISRQGFTKELTDEKFKSAITSVEPSIIGLCECLISQNDIKANDYDIIQKIISDELISRANKIDDWNILEEICLSCGDFDELKEKMEALLEKQTLLSCIEKIKESHVKECIESAEICLRAALRTITKYSKEELKAIYEIRNDVSEKTKEVISNISYTLFTSAMKEDKEK